MFLHRLGGIIQQKNDKPCSSSTHDCVKGELAVSILSPQTTWWLKSQQQMKCNRTATYWPLIEGQLQRGCKTGIQEGSLKSKCPQKNFKCALNQC